MDKKPTPFTPTTQVAQRVETQINTWRMQRRAFERRWYNNNFFDDGYHYRYVSRTTGRIIDLAATSDTFIPYRAIPKSSRQIRGVANLLLQGDLVPVIYPERILSQNYQSPELFRAALELSKENAKKVGKWVTYSWRKLQLQDLLTLMVLLSAKHGVSYIQVFPDPVKESIRFSVYDAFDIFLKGSLTSIYDSPSIIKSSPMTIAEMKANDEFDQEQVAMINPDNKYASSEIKEAYMMARFGTQRPTDTDVTVLMKEAFIKEYISDDNIGKIKKDLGDQYADRKKGDPIIRQIFEAGGIWVRDQYLNLKEYPFVDFRFEPGPIYQVPLIERFIPANKTLDSVMSRLERHIGTMAVGVWMKRKGENYRINNVAGGQEVEYDSVPPAQMQTTSVGQYVFEFINHINHIIEEQGSTTSALAQVPQGVKSGVAIESIKTAEYANLKIANDQLKSAVKRITLRMLDIAANYFLKPQSVYLLEQGEPNYFDIIGAKGMDKYKQLSAKRGSNVVIPNAVTIKQDYQVDIQVENGLGFTIEGKRKTAQQIIEYMRDLAREGYVTPEAVNLVIKKFLETFEYGGIAEFMEAQQAGTPPITDQQLTEMKTAFLEVIKDLQGAAVPPPPTPSLGAEAPATNPQEQDILKVKTGLLSAIKDLQGANNAGQATGNPIPLQTPQSIPVSPQRPAGVNSPAGLQG